jgi:hypothetical protein
MSEAKSRRRLCAAAAAVSPDLSAAAAAAAAAEDTAAADAEAGGRFQIQSSWREAAGMQLVMFELERLRRRAYWRWPPASIDPRRSPACSAVEDDIDNEC